MKEDWAKKMSRKLEGHQMTPPSGLWEGIVKEMNPPTLSTRKPVVYRLSFLAAAATILFFVGAFSLYTFFRNDPFLSNQDVKKMAQKGHSSERPNLDHSAIQNNSDRLTTLSLDRQSVQAKPVIMAEKKDVPTKDREIAGVQDVSVAGDTLDMADESHQLRTFEQREQGAAIYHHLTDIHSPSEKSEKWSIGLNTSGGLLAIGPPVNNYSNVYMYYMNMDAFMVGDGSYRRVPFRSECTSVLTHHLPVRFGLSLSYQLSQRIALISGLNYTYLHSEHVITQENLILDNLRLHYLGIPFGVSWKLWSAHRFSLYLSGGAMAEKCLNGKQWQWSVHASAGADYSLIPQLSLYLEPSVGYYFNDGSSCEHYYKEHPLAPTLEIGLRLHLRK